MSIGGGSMWLKTMLVLGLLLGIGACAVAPRNTGAPMDLWQDQVFAYDPSLVTVSKRSLFELDAELARSLRERDSANASPGTRIGTLMSTVFGPDMKAFAYAGGHSTVAAETWRNRRGDCLSLTVLSYALARALDVPAHMQEVRVPVAFDRRGGVDFLNRHVNVLVHNDRALRLADHGLASGDLVIDFEPQIGSRRKGAALSDEAILARYFNNIASEHLAQGRDALAYAHFRAAILAEPGYAASYSNLAQLYLRAGLAQGAEALLLQALSLDDQSDLALGSLHRLLLSQGREAEAAGYASRLQARRAQDPYYWLGLGLERLQQEQFADAVDALEHAQALTSGFEEVHRYLAIAYWRDGKLHKARDQLAVLSALDRNDPNVAALGKKFGGRPEGAQPQ
jgi:tetratricopeptide (TPR) repeat protein